MSLKSQVTSLKSAERKPDLSCHASSSATSVRSVRSVKSVSVRAILTSRPESSVPAHLPIRLIWPIRPIVRAVFVSSRSGEVYP